MCVCEKETAKETEIDKERSSVEGEKIKELTKEKEKRMRAKNTYAFKFDQHRMCSIVAKRRRLLHGASQHYTRKKVFIVL